MQVNQKLSILFYLRSDKTNRSGEKPINCKVTINGMESVISASRVVHPDCWEQAGQKVKDTHPDAAAINKHLRHFQTDLERHFDLVCAKNGIARPAEVIANYKTPLNGHKEVADRKVAADISHDLDQFNTRCYGFFYRLEKAKKDPRYPDTTVARRLHQTYEAMTTDLAELVERANKLFDDKTSKKTFGMAIDNYLLHFLQLVMVGERSFNTYKKLTGTKRRWQDFLYMRHKKNDLDLEDITLLLLEQFVLSEKTVYQSGHNTIWKYVQILQEILTRAHHNEWTLVNRWSMYDFKYQEPKGKKWLTMEEMIRMINFDLSDQPKRLDTMRWLFVYQSFAAPAYAELEKLDRASFPNKINRIPGWNKVWSKKKNFIVWIAAIISLVGSFVNLLWLPISKQIF